MRKECAVILLSVLFLGCNLEGRESFCNSLEGDSTLLTMTGYVVLNSKGQILLTRGGEDWNTRQIELIPCEEDDKQSLKKWIFGCYDSGITQSSYGNIDNPPPPMWMKVEGKYWSRDTSLKYPQFSINFAALLEKDKALQSIKAENIKLKN